MRIAVLTRVGLLSWMVCLAPACDGDGDDASASGDEPMVESGNSTMTATTGTTATTTVGGTASGSGVGETTGSNGSASSSGAGTTGSTSGGTTSADSTATAEGGDATGIDPGQGPGDCLGAGCDLSALGATAISRCQAAVTALGGDAAASATWYGEDSTNSIATNYTSSIICQHPAWEGQTEACNSFCGGYDVALINVNSSVVPPVPLCQCLSNTMVEPAGFVEMRQSLCGDADATISVGVRDGFVEANGTTAVLTCVPSPIVACAELEPTVESQLGGDWNLVGEILSCTFSKG